VAEALACGLPVLISTAVNISAEVQAAGAGLVQADTLAATGAALEHWQQFSAPQRLAMGQAASRLFAERFELDSNSHRIFNLMQASVERSHGACRPVAP
jgi:glycosyltransferase involved in cell wall biosynthesis